MTSEIKRPVLRYFGGKWLLSDWIIQQLPPHKIYIEPFGGGASILMRKPRAFAELYNDMDSEIVNVFSVLRDPNTSQKLKVSLELTPWARDEFNLSYVKTEDPIEQARRTICRSFMSRGATGASRGEKSGFRSKSYIANNPASISFINYPEEIMKFCERLRGVIIENRNAFEIFDQHDAPDVLWYLDPPYVLDTRNEKHGYKFELSDDQHGQLIERIKTLSGMVVLSGYENDIYDSLNWHVKIRQSKNDGNKETKELLWFNEQAYKAQSQVEMFK